MKTKLFLFSFIFSCFSFSKTITFHSEISRIINNKCNICHYKNSNTPFSLDTYKSVMDNFKMINYVISNGIMPPWKADTSFVKYSNENVLTQKEKETITEWANNGFVEGNSCKSKVKVKKSIIRSENENNPVILKSSSQDLLGNTNTDEFIYYIPKIKIEQNLYVTKFRFVIKDKFLHHSEFLTFNNSKFDSTNVSDVIVKQSFYDLAKNELSYLPVQYHSGWLPGSNEIVFPKNTYMFIQKNSRCMFINHYIPTIEVHKDESYIMVDTVIGNKNKYKEVIEFSFHGGQMFLDTSKSKIFLPKNTIQTYSYIKKIETSISVFAVYSHAHHYAKYIEAYGVNLNNDTIKLLKINHWDFNWQPVYYFKTYQYLEAGTQIYFKVIFDNTINNPYNTIQTIKDVPVSFNSDDEMMELFLLGIESHIGKNNKIEF